MLLEIPERLGSFSSSVTGGSDSDGAEKEQGEKRAAIVHPLDFRPGCGLEREWLLHPSASWGWPPLNPTPSLSPVLAGVYANRFLVRLEVATIPSFRYGRRRKCMQRSYSRKKGRCQIWEASKNRPWKDSKGKCRQEPCTWPPSPLSDLLFKSVY